MKEFCQLERQSVFEPVFVKDLTFEQRSKALRSINLVEEKRCGRIKGRSVADGSKMRNHYAKEDTASPTVTNEGLKLSLVIDAIEGRKVGVADVPGAYLHAEMDDLVHMKVSGEMVKVMTSLNPKYQKYVTDEKGRPVLYVKLLKALYGCVQSALLWYRMFSEILRDMGFVLNPYDPCVANKEIDGSQCTILWYVDDTKISHKDEKVVRNLIGALEEKFGEMTKSFGNSHEFLGMEIFFPGDGTVSIGMDRYIKQAIEEFDLVVSRIATSPARRIVFQLNNTSPMLNEKERENFHSVVARLLYVSIKCRLDIQLPVSFLCSRVSKATKQDQYKLLRILQYLKDTAHDKLILGATNRKVLRSWVDASYACHENMKSHTGGAVSLGRGMVISKSSKQKLVTKSSTEAELVGASDFLPNTIWTKYFLRYQGYEVEDNIYYQDNESALKIEKNGKQSMGQRSKHIDIRYFFYQR